MTATFFTSTIDLLGAEGTSLGHALAATTERHEQQIHAFIHRCTHGLLYVLTTAIWMHEQLRRHVWAHALRDWVARQTLNGHAYVSSHAPQWRRQAVRWYQELSSQQPTPKATLVLDVSSDQDDENLYPEPARARTGGRGFKAD